MGGKVWEVYRGVPVKQGWWRIVNQADLSSECWNVQIWGLKQCKKCEFKNTRECGGKKIRKTGKNELGKKVPI